MSEFWLSQLTGAAIGLVVGAIVSWVFERRALKAAQRENAALREELEFLRESVYSVGASPLPVATDAGELRDQIIHWTRTHQDCCGRVRRQDLANHLFNAGYSAMEVDTEIGALTDREVLKASPNWIEVM